MTEDETNQEETVESYDSPVIDFDGFNNELGKQLDEFGSLFDL